MKVQYIEQPLTYDGTQLKPHWILNQHRILGNAMVAFQGPCDVPIEKMVDLVDVQQNKPIFSKSMLHFIGEFFETDLTKAILLQRLLVSLVQQEIMFRINKACVVRGGNDLFDDGAKLSVSIATASPVSTLIHFGINIISEGTPLKTKGLADYGIDPSDFGRCILEIFKNEVATVAEARAKVRHVV